jgi:hypothetical protein
MASSCPWRPYRQCLLLHHRHLIISKYSSSTLDSSFLLFFN